MNPIEAGARAIAAANHEKWDALLESEKDEFRRDARAAAIAMMGALSDKAIWRTLRPTLGNEKQIAEAARAELVKQLTEE